MPNPLLLEGTFDTDIEDQLQDLRAENARLKRNIKEGWDILNAKDAEIAQLNRALRGLRGQLSPLYKALRGVFGELDTIGDGGTDSISTQPQQSNPKWEFWKKHYPGRIADAIDLLLIQGDMNAKQLCAALKCDPRTLAKSVIYQLNSAGLLSKNGGRFSLKELK